MLIFCGFGFFGWEYCDNVMVKGGVVYCCLVYMLVGVKLWEGVNDVWIDN